MRKPKLEYVKPLYHTGGISVHAIKDDKTAYCGWEYLSDQTLDSRPVPRGYTVEGPLDCTRCMWRLQAEIERYMRQMTPDEVADLYEQVFRSDN